MSREYKVSIVTPFHDVDEKMFAECVKSMVDQKIGFNNIQWIVILHNCEADNEAVAHKYLDKYDNVIVESIHNDHRTPSSPRNYGMQYATADYIGFLDADDSYTTDCLGTVVSAMETEKVQMAWFRREYELESNKTFAVPEMTLFNQSYSKVIMTKDDFRDRIVLMGACGFITSRLFDRNFLVDNGIKFDEEVPFAEDFLFAIEVYAHMEKILFLPQFIGYHYFINSSSLVQRSNKKSPEDIIRYAVGYKKIFSTGLKYGFYMDSVISRLSLRLARAIVACEEITLEDKLKVKELIGEYVAGAAMLPVCKIANKKDVFELYEFPKKVICHPEEDSNYEDWKLLVSKNIDELMNDEDLMKEPLIRILNENMESDLGTRFGFSSMITLDDFTGKLQISTYDMYEPLIKLTTRVGESSVFTSSKVDYYAVVEGLFGTDKIYPETEGTLKPIFDSFKKKVEGKVNYVLYSSLPKSVMYNDRAYLNSLGGIELTEFWAKGMVKNSDNTTFTSPEALLFPEKGQNNMLLRVIYALLNPDVEQIVAPSTWLILSEFQYLTNNLKMLIGCIEEGKAPDGDNDDEKINTMLKRMPIKNPQRAKELTAILEAPDASGKTLIERIWPRLTRVVAEGSGRYSVYTKLLRKYTGNIAIVNSDIFEAGILIASASDDADAYELKSGDVFFEFIDPETKETLFANQISENECYELVMTASSGLYRFKTGRIVYITSKKNNKIYVRFIHYADDAISVSEGEKIYDDTFAEAVNALSDKFDIAIADYTYADSFMWDMDTSNYLRMAVEPSSNKDEFESFMKVRKEDMEAFLDEYLKENSKAYDKARSEGLKFSLNITEPETGLLYRDIQSVKKRLPEDIIMPVHYLNTPAKVRFYKNRSI